MPKLTEDFFLQDTVTAAQGLLGCCLVRRVGDETLAVRITETEAYGGENDRACHAYGHRRTARTETLYAAPGTAYVYLIYGMYCCLNFVTGPEGVASAVLIRGGEAVRGADAIARRRFGTDTARLSAYQKKNFLNGPGKLCGGLAIDRSLNGLPLGSGALYLADGVPELGLAPRPASLPFRAGERIGVDYAGEAARFPWRFWLEGGPLC